MKMLKSLAAGAATLAALSAVPGLGATTIETTTGYLTPKHECDPSGPCVDCRFLLPFDKGTIVCPGPGAIAVDAPIKPKRVAAPWLPADNPGGEAAVGIFFAQNCPGFVTDDARQLIDAISRMRAREAWQPYNEIKTKIAEATKANRTSVAQELYQWCIAAEPRIAAIEDKLGQANR
jgi:hypothetical protein